MRKLVMTGLDRLELKEVEPPPPPAASEATVEVEATGLGMSQMLILAGITHPAPVPRVLGHEVVGRVTALGEGVQHLDCGDFVLLNSLVGCGTCRQCLSGQESVCPRRTFIGMESDGGWADLINLPASRLFKLPVSAPPAETLMVASALPSAYHAVIKAGVRPGQRVAVLGLGTIGLLICQVARAFGATLVVGAQGHSREIPLAGRLMDWHLDLDGLDEDAARRRLDDTLGPDGADVVFEAAGTAEMLQLALKCVRTGGVVLAMGLIAGAQAIRFDDYSRDFVMREVELRTTYAFNAGDFPPTIALYAAGRVELAPLLAGDLQPEDVPAVVARMRREGTGGKRYAIRF